MDSWILRAVVFELYKIVILFFSSFLLEVNKKLQLNKIKIVITKNPKNVFDFTALVCWLTNYNRKYKQIIAADKNDRVVNNARNVSYQLLYGGQFTFSTQLINVNLEIFNAERLPEIQTNSLTNWGGSRG